VAGGGWEEKKKWLVEERNLFSQSRSSIKREQKKDRGDGSDSLGGKEKNGKKGTRKIAILETNEPEKKKNKNTGLANTAEKGSH